MPTLQGATRKDGAGSGRHLSVWLAVGVMLCLPERGTYRSFTDADLERFGVQYKTMRDFMTCVLVTALQEYGFYPPRGNQDA